jgi:hypothetical protein
MRLIALITLLAFYQSSFSQKINTTSNPIIDGYFADPSIVKHDGSIISMPLLTLGRERTGGIRIERF